MHSVFSLFKRYFGSRNKSSEAANFVARYTVCKRRGCSSAWTMMAAVGKEAETISKTGLNRIDFINF